MTARSLRIVFFGTPEIAVPTLERLLASRHVVVSVVTQPDRPRGRGRRTSPSPVAAVALRAGVALLRPESVGAPEVESALRAAAPDAGVVVAFGQFLPKRIRELPACGYVINAHASLLPRWRGAAPIARAILAGDDETGISMMRVEREMDAGPFAARVATPIGVDETAGELEQRLAEIAADATLRALDAIAEAEITWTPQDPALVTFAPKLDREEARLDFSRPAVELARAVRAFAPRPGAHTTLRGEALRILEARAQEAAVDREPGRVARGGEPPLRIATGRGWLVPHVLQRAGGRPLPVAELLRGCDVADGELLGGVEAGA